MSKSIAAEQYVWKEESRVGEQFELGTKSIKRNSSEDWELVRQYAVEGTLDLIPADIFVRYYGNLRNIMADHAKPVACERIVTVYWGKTGVGKSRRAWEEAGMEAYAKDPRSKFWYGYRGEKKVIIDEFRGGIDVAHLLRWLDRYPVSVELKGSSRPLQATHIWITSNLPPGKWYPELDRETDQALLRRLRVEELK